MLNSRFTMILLVVFVATFLWSGGSSVVRDMVPSFDKAPAILSGDAGTSWERIYRIFALKSAVNSKLNKTHYTKLQDIPLALQQAIIAVEDNRFYRHVGFDIEGILRAMLVNLQTGSILEGGSTITQQLIKNLFLNQEQSYARKAEEVILAVDMELRYSKEEILEMYLNTIYFGAGTYGIADASAAYFGKAPAKLNLAECTMLAGLPNSPSLISPYVDFNAAKQRQAVVLAAMVRHGYLGQGMAEEARRTPIRLAK